MNQKVDDENSKSLVIGNVLYQKVCHFSINEFCNNIGCLISYPMFGIGISRLWE